MDFPSPKAIAGSSKTMIVYLNDRHILSGLSKKQLRKEQLMEIDASRTRILFSLLGESFSAYGREFVSWEREASFSPRTSKKLQKLENAKQKLNFFELFTRSSNFQFKLLFNWNNLNLIREKEFLSTWIVKNRNFVLVS